MKIILEKIIYKIRNMFYNLYDNLEQRYLLRKYSKFDIPIKKGCKWYYKEEVGMDKDKKNRIEKYENSLMFHFENYAKAGLHYHYEYGKFLNVSKKKIEQFKDYTHAHEFFSVLEDVYDFPETFYIPDDSKEEYSKQELRWIEKLKKKCLDDGLKDIGYFTEPLMKNLLMGLVYNVGELKKRNILDLHGTKLKKYYKKCSDSDYLEIDKYWNINIIKGE